jgi:hypothetical protein
MRPTTHSSLYAVYPPLWCIYSDTSLTVADLVAKAHTMTGDTTHTVRQAAYGLREVRGKNWSPSPAGPAATTSPRHPHAPSPPCSPCATRSSPRSSPASAVHETAANQPAGPPSTASTKPCASPCKPSSTISGPAAPENLMVKLMVT